MEDGMPIYGEVVDFELTNQFGSPMNRADMDGSIWVVDFIFTSCPGVCPQMSLSMVTLQEYFKDVENVRFLSVSVDPDQDTPEVLEAYGKKHDANFDQWSFLTGTEDDIQTLSVDGFFIGSGDELINHSSKFVLVDREGNLRGYYTGTDSEEVQRLAADIEILRGT
jgi:protein SCO1/2